MTTTIRPPRQSPAAEPAPRGGLAARIRLGRVFAPVPPEFIFILSSALILTGFGIVMILSATSATSVEAGGGPYDDAIKQAIYAAIGIPLMLIVSRVPTRFWKRIAWPLLIAALCGQLLVFVPGLGVTDYGNTNWIHIGGIQAQPSEFIKLALAIWMGTILARKGPLLRRWKHVYIPVIPVAILAMGLVLKGGDLGTTMMLVLVFLGALFFSGVRLRIFILPLLGMAAAVAVAAVTNPNRMRRILSFLDTDTAACYRDMCYQSLHGIWGLSAGGVFGLGLGNSKQKYSWLPAAANDYIFAIVGEELGLIGCLVMIGLFVLMAVGMFHVIRRTQDPFARIVTGAVVTWIIGQAAINIAVVLRVFPVLGVPLPFVSQGGTSLVSVLVACGVILAFARDLPPRARAVAR
ncbi:putative lipid II flippase FtsW [Microbacterium sp. SORGH_AS_0888]|uniref:putative lipid II flippase FtsW n=1 Tax=Microbacterium sp. SORGH_AS_0888 TaxID=3041791 RepID=UPI00278B7BEA|nr:putative lipid II flippase FtsW [Microbacterium sp. SORGH_AS_0888]MDQ1128882.1 cell division protein FtsW [Microbacterium sp. SORGH_AS_0888]